MQVNGKQTLRIPLKTGDVTIELDQRQGTNEFFLGTRASYSKLEDTLKKWGRENVALNEKQYPAWLAKKKATSPMPSPPQSPRGNLAMGIQDDSCGRLGHPVTGELTTKGLDHNIWDVAGKNCIFTGDSR
jgi:hypothetical protein